MKALSNDLRRIAEQLAQSGATPKTRISRKGLIGLVGATGFEPMTSTVKMILQQLTTPRGMPKYAEVVQELKLCGLDCGLAIVWVRGLQRGQQEQSAIQAN